MYRIYSTLLAAIGVFSVIGCDDDNPPNTAYREMLTAGDAKAWNITEQYPLNVEEECRPDAAFIQDNAWIFHPNGDFKFDGGSINGDVKCSDYIDFDGTWEITGNNELKIKAIRASDDPNTVFNGEVILFGTIEEITETSFTVGRNGHSVTFEPKSSF
ncbi:hypothetical protein GCM10009122_03700 [Fulvivirga kasyanovii]|uniref:Lipocalin-like domain-containing protein n=1 Tax=Fulvivirga kasyanovii TaxID=396812 RepID=A0ABW9RL52_9BACT|nr:hypothetical protein [Fulvivirga kasyanovii]MTI24748.1 hypothetical protein [Fulvivirga kasyanovii]